ncbi:TonB-dependent receptor plug domain-containing protein [Alteromonas facilis]|uniref:TonB-dependent receptor plug domain-containing protein n=1 Tax=Alteromonas facilis TaxID=2048004 RepID=UPI0013DCE6AA|nr:TonB-dependent receptor [Alteromonas facilis]
MPLSELLNVEVAVSNRNATPINYTPASVTVYSSAEIESLGVRTLDQLLNYIPGFTVARSDIEGRSYTPVVRGRRSNSVGREILVLLDGIRLNDPVTGGVFSQERGINLANVKQVEVIRGPGSSMYGANAFSGVINIITKDNGRFTQVELGQFNAKSAVLMASHNSQNWGISGTFAYYRDDGDDYPNFYNFFGSLNDTQDPERQTDVFLNLFYKDTKLIVRHNERISYDFIIAGGQANGEQRHLVDNTSIRLSTDNQLGQFDVNWFAEYSINDADSRFGLFPDSPNPIQTGNPLYWSDGITVQMIGGNIRTVKQQRFGADAKYQIAPNHLLNIGLLYKKESVGLNPFQTNIDIAELERTGRLIPSTTGIEYGFYIGGVRFDLFTPSSRRSSGVYAQSSWQVDPSITLTSGLRYDDYEDFGDHLSVRLGLVKKWDTDTTFKLLYGDAFRAPSFVETRAGIASGGISNPALIPEKVNTYELSWTENHDSFSSTFTYFYNQYDDMVVPVLVDDVVPGFTAFQPQNRSNANTSGVEWEVSAELSENLRVRSGASHMFKRIAEEPVGNTSLFVIGEYKFSDFSFNLSAYYHDKVLSRINGNIQLDSYIVTNAMFYYSINEQLDISLRANNLFDAAYTTWSPQAGLEEGIPARGRQVLIGLKYTL